jgi:hypothetical protein
MVEPTEPTEPTEPDDDEPKFNPTIMLVIIILVIVGVIAAALWFRPKVPKPGKFDPQPAEPEKEPPTFNPSTADANKVEPKENIAKEGAVTYVESQTPYDRLG